MDISTAVAPSTADFAPMRSISRSFPTTRPARGPVRPYFSVEVTTRSAPSSIAVGWCSPMVRRRAPEASSTNTILRGHLQPGMRILERDIGRRLGISRTPIREALLQLGRISRLLAARSGTWSRSAPV